jgi:hypothetical protein
MHMTDVLLLVEDPGAANVIIPLLPCLKEEGILFQVGGRGPAESYLNHRQIEYFSLTNQSAEEIINCHTPRLVLVGTSENRDSICLDVIETCRKAGITTIGLIDQMANAEYRFRGRSNSALTYSPDCLFVPDEETTSAYTELGFDSGSIFISGSPHIDLVRARASELASEGRANVKARIFPNLELDKTVIVFLCECDTGLAPDQYMRSNDYLLSGRGTNHRRSAIVLEEFLDSIQAGGIIPAPYIVLRLHPKNNIDELVAYLGEVDYVSSGGSPLELVYAADAVVGMTSIVLVESLILGTPTISITPRLIEKTWLPMGISRYIRSIHHSNEILPALKELLNEQPILPHDFYSSGATDFMIGWIKRFLYEKGE